MTIQELSALPTIVWLQEMTRRIYEKKNKEYSDGDILLHIVERLTAIAEGMRKESQKEIVQALPVFFMWLLSFSNRMGINLEKAVWNKYHGCCPNCGASEHCSCISKEAKPEKWFSDPEAKMPDSITEWQKMFFRIYGRMNNFGGLNRIFSHLTEEVGESSKAFRFCKYRNGDKEKEDEELRNELADIFAQLIGMCNSNRLEVDLAEITYAEYPDVCNKCKEPACTCPLV